MPATRERMSFCLMQIYKPFASISKGILVLSLARMQEERHIENFEKVLQNSYGLPYRHFPWLRATEWEHCTVGLNPGK